MIRLGKNKAQIKYPQIRGALKVPFLLKNWTDYFKDFFGNFKDNELLTFRLRNGLKINVKPNTYDRHMFNEVFIFEEYNRLSKIEEEDIVFDIGANLGMFSLFASKKARKGKVYAFEPVSSVIKQLEENIKLNNLKNIIPVNKAVLNTTGKKIIYISNKDDGNNSFYRRQVPIEDTKEELLINTITLDKFMKDNKIKQIDFLKLDCEGSERDIVFSLGDTINKIKKFSIEVHMPGDIERFVKFFKNNGFKTLVKVSDYSKGYSSGGDMVYAERKLYPK